MFSNIVGPLFLKDPFFFRLFRGRNSCYCVVELVKLLPVHRYSVDNFHILDILEYLILAESRLSLKLVLGSVRIIALSNSSHEQTQ